MTDYQNPNIDEIRNVKIRHLLAEFIKDIDPNLKYFCRLVRQDLREERDYVIAITGYPGTGKSQLATILAILIDYCYSFGENVCFIPTAKDIEEQYLNLPMYSVLHIDEASRGIHKHKWQDRMQQKLNELYDTDREGHFLCTLLLMPRFQNFSENFRNFRVKYWININERGLATVFKRDEDKDAKDPWHLDENYKLKQKRWGKKKIYDRDIPDIIRMEQQTLNYWFYFSLPPIPREVWSIYQDLKKESRIKSRETVTDLEVETTKERLARIRVEKWKQIAELRNEGKTLVEIGFKLGLSSDTIKKHIRDMDTWQRMKGKDEKVGVKELISNQIEEGKNLENKAEVIKQHKYEYQ